MGEIVGNLVLWGILYHKIFVSIFIDLFRFVKMIKGNIQPTHVFQINFGISVLCRMAIFNFINISHLMINGRSAQSCPHYLVALFFIPSVSIDILIMQADRFMAVLWSLHYPGIATNPGCLYLSCVQNPPFFACSFCSLFPP